MEKEASHSGDTTKLFSHLNSLEQLSQDWPEQYKLGIEARIKAIEDINKEAFTRIIRFLKSIPEMENELKAMVKDELVFSILRRYEILKPPLHERIEQSLDRIRPMLQGHGGDIEFIGLEDGVVKVNFTGACDGCPASTVTFYEGVKKTLLEDIPEIKDIKQVKQTNIHQPSRLQQETIRSPFMSTEQWEVILRVDEILDKQTLFLTHKQHNLILHRSDEKVTCFENLCAHLGLSLNGGSIQEEIITCPHHGFQYSLLSGECLTAPEIQLSTKKVRIHQGNIELSLGK